MSCLCGFVTRSVYEKVYFEDCDMMKFMAVRFDDIRGIMMLC